MNQEKIKCPECGHMIELSEAISHDIEDKVKSKFEQQIQAIKKESQDALTHKEEEFNLQLTKAKADLTAKAQKEALESVNLDLSD